MWMPSVRQSVEAGGDVGEDGRLELDAHYPCHLGAVGRFLETPSSRMARWSYGCWVNLCPLRCHCVLSFRCRLLFWGGRLRPGSAAHLVLPRHTLEGASASFGLRHGDDGSVSDRGVGHDHILLLDRGDPFAAAFEECLRC
jgi:hypothetical protein